jgi:DNA-binding transcriptional LysR family regulator
MVAGVDFRQFRYFIAVAEELHFGRAAERLHIAQSGLSQQILKLERSVGVQLLRRDRRGVALTEAGRIFLDHARQAVDLADRAMASPRLAERGRKGLLRVGTPILGIPVAAETVLKEFSARFPEVEVEIHPRLDPELIEGVSTHSLDVAVVLAPFRSVDPPPRYQQLSTFELLAIVPEGHRLTELDRVPRRELLQEQLLGWPRNINPEMIDHIHRILFGASDHPQMLYVPELEEARRHERVANGEGIGIAVLPPGMERRAPGVVFLHFEEPTPFINYGVAWSDTQSSPWMHEFLEVASEFADPKVPSGPA